MERKSHGDPLLNAVQAMHLKEERRHPISKTKVKSDNVDRDELNAVLVASPEVSNVQSLGVIESILPPPPALHQHTRHISLEDTTRPPDSPECSSRKALGVMDFCDAGVKQQPEIQMEKMSNKTPTSHRRHVSLQDIRQPPESPECSSNRKCLGIIDDDSIMSRSSEDPVISSKAKSLLAVTTTATKSQLILPPLSPQGREPTTPTEKSSKQDTNLREDPISESSLDYDFHCRNSSNRDPTVIKGHLPGSRVKPGRALEPPDTPENSTRQALGVLDFSYADDDDNELLPFMNRPTFASTQQSLPINGRRIASSLPDTMADNGARQSLNEFPTDFPIDTTSLPIL